MEEKTRVCTECKQEKNANQFYKDRLNNKGGRFLRGDCKPCYARKRIFAEREAQIRGVRERVERAKNNI